MNDANFPTPPLRILVVDDSATSRAVIEKQLKKLGCDVMVAQDGTSGLAALVKDEYDLVLLDCQMPDVSGYEVAQSYRVREREEERAHTPIIAISAETDAAHMQLCLNSGMDGVLGKPLPADVLKKMLSLWCDTDVASASPITEEEMSSADLILLFRATSLEDFKAMQTSASQSDLNMVSQLAHRMKGAALTMAEASIVATLERIEAIATHHARPADSLTLEIEVLREQLQKI